MYNSDCFTLEDHGRTLKRCSPQAFISVSIPDSVNRIAENAFAGCDKLDQLNIPSNVTEIDDFAFASCSIKQLTISGSIKALSKGFVANCYRLEYIKLPISIEYIQEQAFLNCTSLKNLLLPDNVRIIGAQAFKGCRYIGLALPKNLKVIEERAFENSSLANSCLPQGLTEIGDYAFNGCWGINIARIPQGVQKIGKMIFGSVNTNQTIIVSKDIALKHQNILAYCSYDFLKEHYDQIIDKNIYYSKLTEICPDESYILSDDTKSLMKVGALIEILNVPNSTEVIEQQACYSTNIKELYLPDSVVKIEKQAFAVCPLLEKIVFGNYVQIIGEFAFAHCTKLKEIRLPESVEKLEERAFWGCSSLEYIEFPSTIRHIADDVLCGCSSLKKLVVYIEDPAVFPNNTTSLIHTNMCELYVPEISLKKYSEHPAFRNFKHLIPF